MRILRVRRGFQADHSSSSYLFYAVDRPVSDAGQAIADRYSSRAEVDEQYARYSKWGESELNPEAFEALLDEHYDVMAEESYGWWTLMIAVPKTPEMKAALAAFPDARGDNDQGVDIEEYGKRMAVTIYCQFEGDGVDFLDGDYDSDIHEILVELLAKVRAELIEGNTSFLAAVAEFYDASTKTTRTKTMSDDRDDGQSRRVARRHEQGRAPGGMRAAGHRLHEVVDEGPASRGPGREAAGPARGEVREGPAQALPRRPDDRRPVGEPMSAHAPDSSRIQRHPAVRLRREAWGGFAFHRDTRRPARARSPRASTRSPLLDEARTGPELCATPPRPRA